MTVLDRTDAPPETDWGTCPHGCKRGVNRLAAGSYNAPLGTCRCCGTSFVYVGRGTWTGTVTDVENPDPTLCKTCGGRPYRFRKEDGVVVVHEHGSRGT